jgi:hypothetical protein
MPTLTDLHSHLLGVIVYVEIASLAAQPASPVYSCITFDHTDSGHHCREMRSSLSYRHYPFMAPTTASEVTTNLR